MMTPYILVRQGVHSVDGLPLRVPVSSCPIFSLLPELEGLRPSPVHHDQVLGDLPHRGQEGRCLGEGHLPPVNLAGRYAHRIHHHSQGFLDKLGFILTVKTGLHDYITSYCNRL